MDDVPPDGVGFVVLVPRAGLSADQLRLLGEALQNCLSRYPHIRAVMGLKRLLAGEYPEVSAWHLGLPISEDPQTWNERLAYVWVEPGQANQATYTALCASLPMELIALAVDPGDYNYMNR